MRSVAPFALVLLLGWNARADVPKCNGNDPNAAADALRRSKELFNQAFEQGTTEMDRKSRLEEALRQLDTACQAGELGGLRRRATVLAVLHRWVEAAETIDAYIASAGDRKLEADEQEKFDAVRKQVDLHVGTYHVLTAPNVHVYLDGAVAGTGPMNVHAPEGAHKLGIEGTDKDVTFKLGEVQELDLRPAPAVDPTPVAKDSIIAVEAPQPHHMGAIVGGSIATGVLLGVAIGGAGWAEQRAQTFNTYQCGGPAAPPGCSSVKSEYDAARGLEVGAFIGTGIAAVVTSVFIYLQLQKPQTKAKWACGALPGAVSCGGSF
jgi:hypothetical protein